MRPLPRPLLLVTAAGAVAGFGLLARAVAHRQTTGSDETFRDQVQSTRTSVDEGGSSAIGEGTATATGPLGKEWLHGPLALGLSAYLWHRGAGAEALAPALASAAAELQSRLCDRYPLRRVPPGHPHQGKPSFPSGHALESSAVGITAAYVLSRERIVDPIPAFGVAVGLSAASTAGRIYLDRHWLSDVLGGWLLGVATAAVCAVAYDAAKLRSSKFNVQSSKPAAQDTQATWP